MWAFPVRILSHGLLAVATVVTTGALSLAAAQGQEAAVTDERLQETLMGLERAFFQAMEDRDAEKIRRMMGPDGIYVNSSAAHHSTEETIEAIMRFQMDAVFLDRVLMRRFGPDIAVLVYDMKLRPEMDLYAITAVYVRRGDEWLGVYHHGGYPRRGQNQAPASPTR